MNIKYRLASAILTASLLFTGCGAAQAAGAAESNSSSAAVISESVTDGTSGNDASVSDSAGSKDNSDASAASENSTSKAAASADYFSDRDLSGEYDAAEAITISLSGTTAEADSDAVSISDSTVTITAAGTYILYGTLKDGCVIIDADKEDKIQLVLDNAEINSETFAAIYVVQADKVFITLADGSVNTLSNGGSFVPIDDNDVDAVVFAKDDITFNGTGSLEISSPAGHGIVGKDEITITNGTYEITSEKTAIRANDSLAIADGTFTITAGTDGLHAENNDDDTLGAVYIADGSFTIKASDDGIHATTLLQIDGGSFSITAAEGLEATGIVLNSGKVSIAASDDGVNAASKSSAFTPYIEINGGELTVVMGAGDTDALDANGNIEINGGTLNITAQSPFDYDGTAKLNGGTLIVNGETVNAITNQMMGGMGGMGGMFGGRQQDGGTPQEGGTPPEGGMQPGDGSMPEGGRGGGMPPEGGMGPGSGSTPEGGMGPGKPQRR